MREIEIEIDLNDVVVRSAGLGKWRGLNPSQKWRVKCLLRLLSREANEDTQLI